MNILDTAGLNFFRREMLAETNQQIRLFEAQRPSQLQELGRIRLYEERAKITRHFESCDKNIGVYLNNRLHQALLGRVENGTHCLSLTWEEQESLRHSLTAHTHTDILWEKNQNPPKVLLTAEGNVVRKYESL
jgi:hypothetical protein